MTNTNSTLSILLFASVAASSPMPSFFYDINPEYNLTEAAFYNVQKEISEWDKTNMTTFSQIGLSCPEWEKLDTILNFAQQLISESKDIDNEFVEIVNKNFWDLI